jgi:hypothetical protein
MSGSASKAAQTLTVSARDVVEQKFDPAAYPYRHVAVVAAGKVGTPDAQIPLVMTAVETLTRIGWELAGFTMANRTVVAVLRRLP